MNINVDSQCGVEMPKYRSHKTVWALKIKSVEQIMPTIDQLDKILNGGTDENHAAIITPEEAGYAPFGVSLDYTRKHEPKAGGYYVVYADGYKSFSPAAAFEEGYTRIGSERG